MSTGLGEIEVLTEIFTQDERDLFTNLTHKKWNIVKSMMTSQEWIVVSGSVVNCGCDDTGCMSLCQPVWEILRYKENDYTMGMSVREIFSQVLLSYSEIM